MSTIPLWKPALLASLITVRALCKKNLTPAGSAAAWFVGFFSATQGAAATASLLAFFFSSSYVTRWGKDVKKKIESEYHEAGHRSSWQVFCNGGTATAVAALAFAGIIPSDRRAILSVIAHYAACQGDTWSSEIGVLSNQQPRLILGFRQVPRGTNGGVTLLGTAAAAAGGMFQGLITAAVQHYYPIPGTTSLGQIAVCVSAAVAGSVVDSILGQLFQRSCVDDATGRVTNVAGRHICGLDLLSNNAVNFISALVVTVGTYFVV